MSITRTAIVDDDGSRTTGTVIGNAWKQELYDQIDAAGGVQSIATARTDTGAVNNWAAPLAGNTYIPWNGASDATFSGLAGGVAGQIAWVENITAAKVAYFLHASGLSSAANQFTNTATSGATPIAPGGKLAYLHNGTNWRLIFHDQGAWISPTYAAGNFSGPVAWTVDAGDVTTMEYIVRGRTVTVAWQLNTTSYAGGSNILYINNGAWGGFTAAKTFLSTSHTYSDAAAGLTIGLCEVIAADTKIQLFRALLANYSAATNTTSSSGVFAFEVT